MENPNFLPGRIKERDVIHFLGESLQLLGKLAQAAITGKVIPEEISSLFKLLVTFFRSDQPTFTISEFHGQIQINEAPLSVRATNDLTVDAFAFFLLERNLRSIVFSKGISETDFSRFLNLLVARTPVAQLEKQLLAEGITSVKAEQQVVIPESEENEVGIQVFGKSPEEETEVPPPGIAEETVEAPKPGFSFPETEKTKPSSPLGRLNVKVTVGLHPLQGARVKVLKTKIPPEIINQKEGVFFDLSPGTYELEIRYEHFKVKRYVDVAGDKEATEVSADLQQIFDF